MQRTDLVGHDTVWRRPAVASVPQAPGKRQHTDPRLRARGGRKILALALLVVTLVGSVAGLWRVITPAQASCPSYTIHWGDTLWQIALRYHTTTTRLAQLNHLTNPNYIIAGRTICVGSASASSQSNSSSSSGLEWSNRNEVRNMLIAAADQHHLPRNLVLAIAWQESNWTQHVISWDGGVGTMQLMWYTADWLNSYLRTGYNSYRLWDNIQLGTSYLAILWHDFGGNLNDIISAYNEGERAVRTRGIFNWNYVVSVVGLMRYFG